ncbi:MAG: alanine racemase [Candidatus Berkelbacteria bacterium Licking1014_2]|uniref:Alanine racemase n=1 Tax=Candidatus Berkelbacteria bacterium Licking1014_2 TaxID=2017146 RepID=A0A554LV67_9BACT|nr:MAG: alanine racemase [Candidatus Berkelbacteria bacterium Licking1014_2]
MIICQVNLKTIRQNIEQIKKRLAEQAKFCLVVKSNAYGHGLIEVSRVVEPLVDYLAVFEVGEGLELRANNIKQPILILGAALGTAEINQAIENNLTLSIYHLGQARDISAAAIRRGRPAIAHLTIDSGLHREGILASNVIDREKAKAEIKEIGDLPAINLEGVWSHLSRPSDLDYSQWQIANFQDLLFLLQGIKIEFPLRHLAASEAFFYLPKSYLEMIRIGSAAYGIIDWPLRTANESVRRLAKEIIPQFPAALNLMAKIVGVKTVPPGSYIGYGEAHQVRRKTRLALLPVGYGDGLWREMSGQIEVLIAGRRYKSIGKISMNQMMVDITSMPTDQLDRIIGREAVLLGGQGDEIIKPQDWAKIVNTNSREITVKIPQSVKREYII